MFELCYTSLSKGLAPGSSGYTTVGQSPQMRIMYVKEAEKLSSFQFLNVTDPRAFSREPVNYIHLQLTIDKQKVHIVSRIAACQPDHTGRSNYFAHHTLLSPQEARPCTAGPAQLAASRAFLMTEWTGEARILPPRDLPAISNQGTTDNAIKAAGLDPGWGPVLADRLRDRGIKQTYLVYSLGTDMLGIVVDVLSNLTPEERWQATFVTHATKTFPPLGFDCRLRCVVADTPYAKEVLSRFPKDTIDLSKHPAAPPRQEPSPSIEFDDEQVRPKTFPRPPVPTITTPKPIIYTTPIDPNITIPSTVLPPYIEHQLNGADRRGQFGLGAILIPSVLFLLMSIACVLLGYKWMQEKNLYTKSNQQVSRLEKKNGELESESRGQLKEIKQLKESREQLEKKLKDRSEQSENPEKKSEEPKKPKPTKQKPSEQDEEHGIDTTPPKDVTTLPKVVITPPKDPPKPTSRDFHDDNDTAHSDKPVTDNGPQVHVNFHEKMKEYLSGDMKKKESILLFEKEDKPSLVSVTSTYDDITSKFFSNKHEHEISMKINGKPTIIFKIACDENISVEMPEKGKPYLARFVTLNFKFKEGREATVPLGSPFESLLHVDLPGGSGKDDAYLTFASSYKLFAETEVNDLITKLQTDFQKDNKDILVESFEFDNSESCSYVDLAKTGSSNLAQFAFKTPRKAVPANSIGVGFKNRGSAEYQVSSFLIDPISYTGLDFCEKGLKGKTIFLVTQINDMTTSYVSQIKLQNDKLIPINNRIGQETGTEKEKDQKEINEINAKVTKLQDAQGKDGPAFSDAQMFPLSNLRRKKVRFTLKVPNSQKEFVIVDSLGK